MPKENIIKDQLMNQALQQLAVMSMGKSDYFNFLNKIIDQGIAKELDRLKSYNVEEAVSLLKKMNL